MFLQCSLFYVVSRILCKVSSPLVDIFLLHNAWPGLAHLKNTSLILNPTLNLITINEKVFYSLINNFFIFMMPLNYCYFFFFFFSFDQDFLVGAILIETFLFVFKKKLKQHPAQVVIEHFFKRTFLIRTFLKSIVYFFFFKKYNFFISEDNDGMFLCLHAFFCFRVIELNGTMFMVTNMLLKKN